MESLGLAARGVETCSQCDARSEHAQMLMPLPCGAHHLCASCVHDQIYQQYDRMLALKRMHNIFSLQCSTCDSTSRSQRSSCFALPLTSDAFVSPVLCRMLQKVKAISATWASFGALPAANPHRSKCKVCNLFWGDTMELRKHLPGCVSTVRCGRDGCARRVLLCAETLKFEEHVCPPASCEQCERAVPAGQDPHALRLWITHSYECVQYRTLMENLANNAVSMLRNRHVRHASPLQTAHLLRLLRSLVDRLAYSASLAGAPRHPPAFAAPVLPPVTPTAVAP